MRSSLLKHVEKAVQALLASALGSLDPIFDDNAALGYCCIVRRGSVCVCWMRLFAVLQVIERVFKHGWRGKRRVFGRRSDYWATIRELRTAYPPAAGAIDNVDAVSQIRSTVGKVCVCVYA